MALDIHAYESGKMGRLLFQIDDRAYGNLQPAFELFRQRTGKFVDPYGDIIIGDDMGTLIDALEEAGDNPVLLDLLRGRLADKLPIIFVGD